MEYLTKPVNQSVVVNVLKKAMDQIDQERMKRSNDLQIREKLEIVIPIIESNFIYAVLSEKDFIHVEENFRNLLGITEDYAMMMVMEFGDCMVDGILTNPVGVSVKAQSFYSFIRDSLKEEFTCIVGPIMVNRIPILIPSSKPQLEYDDRNALVDKARKVIRDLIKRTDIQFKIGIGSVKKLQKQSESYQEALSVIRNSKSRVAHVKDLPIGCEYAEDYPIEIEKALFEEIEKGNVEETKVKANIFFDWMITHYPDCMMDIQLKVLEFILFAEQKAFLSGGMTYYFRYRKDYLKILMEMKDYSGLKKWFIDKLMEACRNINTKKEEQASGIIAKAKAYINENYHRDISLEEVSRSVDISSYYFSKLFKEETGENFIEYLTSVRIEKAKALLHNKDISIKSICIETGYSDPNYFSRIFKKQVGITPTEFRERIG